MKIDEMIYVEPTYLRSLYPVIIKTGKKSGWTMRTPYTNRKDYEKELEPFDPNKEYTARELEAYANQMLREDIAENKEGPRVLFQEHIEPKWRKEVNSTSGTVDDAITNSMSNDGQRIYNRTHPQGRKVNSPESRKRHGASYYR
jgi:hypothetical protein